MPYKKIMVPYDGSDHAKSALEHAKAIAKGNADARVFIVHVVPSGVLGADLLGTGGALDGVPAGMIDYEQYQSTVRQIIDHSRQKVYDNLGDSIADLGSRVSVEVVAGASPVEALARYVEQNDVDLVVMGRRGLGAIRGMLGSVSFGVLRSVECPVLTVK